MNSKENRRNEEVFINRPEAGLALQKLEHTSNEIETNIGKVRE